jgi:heat shock protein HspQ
MTSGRDFLKWLTDALGARKATAPDKPLLLDQPIRRSGGYKHVESIVARYQIGNVVRHRHLGFRGVIFDVDPQFSNTEEWYESIPEEIRPHKDQPFYHLFAENERAHYIAYVSEQNLELDDSGVPVSHPDIPSWFDVTPRGQYTLKKSVAN